MANRIAAVVAVAVVLGLLVSPAAAESVDPRFEAYVTDPVLDPGEEAVLTVQLLNDAADVEDVAETAPAVSVTMRAGSSPLTVHTGTRLVGDFADGDPHELVFRVAVPRDAAAGEYRLPIELRYEFEDETKRATVSVPVTVTAAARFEVRSVASDAPVGEAGTLDLVIEHVGGAVAYDAAVELESPSPEVTFGAGAQRTQVFVGQWAPGETRSVTADVQVAESAGRTAYPLGVTVDYEDDAGRARAARLAATLEPAPRQTFAVVEMRTTAPIGGVGDLVVRLENAGPAPAHGATVTVSSADGDVRFAGEAAQAGGFVGDWAPGEVKALTFRLRVGDQAVRRDYPLRATVRYEDADGTERRPRSVLGAVRPLPEQTFGLRDLTSTLAVGSTGSVGATVANTGESDVRDVVVVLQPGGSGLAPRAVEYPVGDLDAGETAAVEFTVDVPDTAAPGPRQLGFLVRYEAAGGEPLDHGPLGGSVDVAARDPTFTVEPGRGALEVDATGVVTIRVTNALDEPVSDVSVAVSVSPPLETADTAAFAGRLAPGQTARLRFEIEATEDAIPKTYPVQVDVSYRDAAGTLKESGPHRVGVAVTQPEGSGLPVAPIAAVVVVLVVAGAWWYRRR